jgi:hypothetical protein
LLWCTKRLTARSTMQHRLLFGNGCGRRPVFESCDTMIRTKGSSERETAAEEQDSQMHLREGYHALLGLLGLARHHSNNASRQKAVSCLRTCCQCQCVIYPFLSAGGEKRISAMTGRRAHWIFVHSKISRYLRFEACIFGFT